MPYAERRDGAVVGLYANAQPGYAEEFLSDDDSEVVAFRSPPAAQPSPSLYAVAKLTIAPGDVSGIDVNTRFSAALYMDVGSYLLFFAETQPDTSYLAKAYDDLTAKVAVTEATEDYITITATDDGGAPTDPAVISVEIIRIG